MRLERPGRLVRAILSTYLAVFAFHAAGDTLAVLTVANQLAVVEFNPFLSVGTPVPITGLTVGETVAAIDTRPANGLVYGLGVSGSSAHLYRLDLKTGVATGIGGAITLPQSAGVIGSDVVFGFDFNPTADRIRVVANNGDNFRINPSTGGVAGVDTALTAGSSLAGAAHDQNHYGTSTTTLFGIDALADTLVRIGGVNGAPSPNGGVVTTIGPLGVNTTIVTGFDIAPSGTAYAALDLGFDDSRLYTIDLATGASTFVGSLGTGILGISAISSRGDVNGDGAVSVADVFYLINFLFAGGPPPAY
jgi:hypothetical protein